MVRYFKTIRLLYNVVMLSGVGIISIIFLQDNQTHYDRYFFLIWILWFLITALVYLTLARRKSKELRNILYEDCDAIRFIELVNALIHDKIYKKGSFNVKMLQCSGLYYTGQHREVLQLLEKAATFANGKKGTSQRLMYYNNAFLAYIRLNELEKAKEMLQKFCEFFSEEMGEIWKNQKAALEFSLNIALKNYDGAEAFFQKRVTESKYKLERITSQFTIGRVNFDQNDFTKARAAFEYVTANGNSLFIVREAEEYLNKMNCETA